MKKLLAVLLSLFVVLSLAGCSNNGGGNAEPPAEEDNTTKIAVLMPFRGDQSYWDTLATAADEVNADDNGITVDVFECDPAGAADESNWMNWYDNVCEEGKYDLVVSGNETYEGFLYTACEKYPDQKFYNFDCSNEPENGLPANCYGATWALDDLGYVVGALSAAVTKTGIVGVVVGKDFNFMNQFISGWCQVLAEKDVKYLISYPDSFTDAALGKETTAAMIEKGADVIWQVAGGLGNGVIDACSEHEDVWCIGVDQDQYLQFKDSNPTWANSILTSALKNTNVAFKAVCEMVADGSYSKKLGTHETWGIALNGVGLAENDYYLANASEEIRNKVADTLAQVASGAVEVVDTKAWDEATYETEWPKVRDANRVD